MPTELLDYLITLNPQFGWLENNVGGINIFLGDQVWESDVLWLRNYEDHNQNPKSFVACELCSTGLRDFLEQNNMIEEEQSFLEGVIE